MLISSSHNLVFVHIPRTGGSSIVHAMYFAGVAGKMFHHQPVSFARKQLGDDFDNYLKFCVIREPFDRAISIYKITKQAHVHGWETFSEFVIAAGKDVFALNQTCWPQVCWIDAKMDKYIRFDNLASEFKQIMSSVNVLVTTIPKLKNSVRKPIDEYYTPELRRIIERVYKKDFKLWET